MARPLNFQIGVLFRNDRSGQRDKQPGALLSQRRHRTVRLPSRRRNMPAFVQGQGRQVHVPNRLNSCEGLGDEHGKEKELAVSRSN